MLTLPSARPASVKSFWLVLSIGIGLLSVLCLYPYFSSWSLFVSTLGVVALVGWGFNWPRIAYKAYRGYNLLARRLAYLSSLFLMNICFYIILEAVGRQVSSLALTRSFEIPSFWVSRTPLARSAYKNQHSLVTGSNSQHGRNVPLWSWAVRSGNVWVCCLLPFLGFLSLLSDDQDNAVPTDLYTLF